MSEPEAAAFLQVTGLCKSYAGVPAVSDVDLTLKAGTIVGLVGKNGAGKSTVIKVLAGLVDADSGDIRLDDEPADLSTPQAAAAARLAFVHQELALVDTLSVTENVLMGIGMPRRPWGAIHWSEAHRRVAAVLEDLDITVDPHTAVGQLSVAHQRMVMIARGVIAQARLLVLDEPTASLTNTEIESLFVVLNRMRARGVCIVYVSHRLAEITALTDSVVVMRDGRVIAEVATSELDRRRLIELIAGRSAAEETARLRPPVVSTGPVLLSVEALADGGLVRDVSIEVRAGEVLGLAGLVGSGRTELANLVFGAGKPTGGAIRVAGKQVSFRGPYDAVAHGIALLPEDRRGQGNIESYSVRENISLPSLPSFRRGRVAVPSVREERAAASRLADELSIKVPSIGARVGTLSGGNQQKVVLAKWLHHGADVFIFDEPTHGIDVDGKEDVYRRMRELADEGKGVVFISSEFEELAANCDRAIVLREGTVAGELAGEKITEEALLDLCYARDDVA